MDKIKQLLDLTQWDDLEEGKYNYAAKKRIDIAPLAYEIVVNKPLTNAMVEKVVTFGGGASAKLIRDLYSLCNGLHIGATRFSIYGVLIAVEGGVNPFGYFPPFDIESLNLYSRPSDCPDEYLLVASHYEREPDKKSQQIYHAITNNESIVVVKEGSFDRPIREYKSIEKWIEVEVASALKQKKPY